MNPFTKPVRPSDVGDLIDLTVAGVTDTRSMADMQLDGIAAIYNILCDRRFAYLADEVGMGKTYQAMGLAALIWNEKPGARILFISPRQNLQEKWHSDYQRFFASNYRRSQGLGDDRATSVLFGQPLHRPVLFHNLRSWTPSIGMPERIAPFVRHTSFTRPVYLSSTDLGDMDMDELWTRINKQLRSWGLFEAKPPQGLSPDKAPEQINLAFADALNAKLSDEAGGLPYFDLAIVDEAQCLRNPWNQTNQVLFTALKGQVGKWLFMSATPAHGGPSDLPTILNHYPECGEVLDPDLAQADNLPAMQKALQAFLVRRQRRYHTMTTMVGKEKYRNHDLEGWGVRDDAMSTLGTLAMGLVQKGLVDVLQGMSNRYRIGFLSSFESLQSSIGRTLPAPTSGGDTQDEQETGDWHRNQADDVTKSEAPDTNFIGRLAADFEDKFGMPLPHPKVDSVVDRVAPLAFGTATEKGGQKFLIFTRRVSTVDTLRKQLLLRHQQSVEARMRRCWGVDKLDWSGKSIRIEEADDNEDPEGFDTEPGESPFREAMSKRGWLFRYRQTFRASGRNALFFEDGWLQRLCVAGGVDPAGAAEKLPDYLWKESWTHASRSAGARSQQFRANRLRYLAVQAVNRRPDIFGLTKKQAKPWKTAYNVALREHSYRAHPDDKEKPHSAPELFSHPTLWTTWDERFPEGPLALPAPMLPNASPPSSELLYQRQVARTLLGQTFRLTDTLLDLYFADKQTEHNATAFPKRFLEWLSSNDAGARQLRHDCTQWVAHLRLIVDGCLDGAGQAWSKLALKESWPQLYNPMPVLGVTGGSGAHRTATRQFRTPSLPRVIVCTDTLKEGVDLHLFCDRVLHYGVAWTSGDLEQRVGRVDRFFSLIERRLHTEGAPPDVKLHIGYPHVVASLERSQVERVIERQKQTELLMDSPLAGGRHESKEMVVGASTPREQKGTLEPYSPAHSLEEGRNVVVVSKQKALDCANHYKRWYQTLTKEVEAVARSEHRWCISSDDHNPVPPFAKLHCGKDRQHDIKWTFDAALGRYVLTLSNMPRKNDGGFSSRMPRNREVESFLQLLVPTPDEEADGALIARLVSAIEGQHPKEDTNAKSLWGEPLASLANGGVEWISDHKVSAVIPRGDRKQRITLYAYDGGVRIVSVVAKLKDLEHRGEWGGEPSAYHVRDWALDTTNDLALGYLDVDERDRLVFGNHVLHGELSENARQRLVEEVAWRADAWEAALTGADRR